MISTPSASALDSLFAVLANASLAGGIVASAAWVAGHIGRSLPAATRTTIWWLVSLKLLVALVWLQPIVVPILPPQRSLPSPVPQQGLQQEDALGASAGASPPVGAAPRQARSFLDVSAANRLSLLPPVRWRASLVLVWLIGVALVSARFARQLRRDAAMTARASIAAPACQAAARTIADRLGVSRVPQVLESDEIAAPMVVGLVRPAIVVPRARFDSLTPSDQRMVLCHELAHLRRRDLWLGLVPAVAERLFFFHPMARLAAREYLAAREAACDADVLRAIDVSPRAYGQLLLTLGVTPTPTGVAAASASRTFSTLRRRIVMLGHPSPTYTMRLAGWLLAAAAACTLVPLQLVARAVEDQPTTISLTDDLHLSVPPAAAMPQQPAAKAAAPAPEGARDRQRIEYALRLDDRHTISHGAMDSRRLERLRGSSPRILWFRVDGLEYVVRDPAAIDRAEEITRVLGEIGAEQGEVGAKQGAIGAKQGEVGANQGAIGARQGEIAAKQGQIGAKQGALGAREGRGVSDAERREIDRERERLDAQMRALDDQMRALDEEMRRASQPMADLDAEMRKLDAEMRVLDGKMREASMRVEAQLKELIDRLLSEKTAQPLN